MNLRHFIEVRRRTETGQTSSGQPDVTWATLFTTFADVSQRAGSEEVDLDQRRGRVSTTFTIRWHPLKPKARDVVRFEGREFEIAYVVDETQLERYFTLETAELGDV